MGKQSFIRYEEKFLINTKQKEELVKYALKYLDFDQYSVEGKTYPVHNIYYDTEDYHIIRESMAQPPYKEKLRLRSYKCPVCDTDLVFLEMKKKIHGLIVKRRIQITYKEAMDYLIFRRKPILTDYVSNQVFNEIAYFLEQNEVKAKMFVGYDRCAMYSKNADGLRVTFDKNIVCRKQQLALSSCDGDKLIKPDEWLMEIKSIDNFPLWLVMKLNELNIFSKTYSKYGSSYTFYSIGETK